MRDDIFDTERQALRSIADSKRAEREEQVETRVEDVEDNLNPLNEEIVKLTPSDDLDTVKRAVNQIIDILSRN